MKDDEKFAAAVHRIDIALYAGKAEGSNRVLAATSHYPEVTTSAV